jgi:hypothetical protein
VRVARQPPLRPFRPVESSPGKVNDRPKAIPTPISHRARSLACFDLRHGGSERLAIFVRAFHLLFRYGRKGFCLSVSKDGLRSESAAQFKTWTIRHGYDPENGKEGPMRVGKLTKSSQHLRKSVHKH